MATVLITGGTGMIGSALTKELLQNDHHVIILSRDGSGKEGRMTHANLTYANWDIERKLIDETAIANSDHIIHLAGAGVADKQWSKKRKAEIISSRVRSAELLLASMKRIPNHIKGVTSASAIGWYGPDRTVPDPIPFGEDDPSYDDFLGNTCRQWENSIQPCVDLGKRLVILRTGIVLSDRGGALPEFLKPLRFGLATILSSGKQVMSWIDIDDLVRIYVASIIDEKMKGVYNAVAPHPVTNKQLVLEAAHIYRGKFFIPVHVPAFALKLALGEMSIEVLKSATVSGDKVHSGAAAASAFTFLHPMLESSLRKIRERSK